MVSLSKIRGRTRPVRYLSCEAANKYSIDDNTAHIKMKADFGNFCSHWPNNIPVALDDIRGHG